MNWRKVLLSMRVTKATDKFFSFVTVNLTRQKRDQLLIAFRPDHKHYSQNTRTFPLPVLKLVLYFSSIASISGTSSVILQLLQKPYDHNMNIVHIYDTVV